MAKTIKPPLAIFSGPAKHIYIPKNLANFRAASSMREVPISNNERVFILEALKQGLRVDGRSPFDLRTIDFKFGTTPGVVLVQLGRTRCVQ
jgi:hypothetical protein